MTECPALGASCPCKLCQHSHLCFVIKDGEANCETAETAGWAGWLCTCVLAPQIPGCAEKSLSLPLQQPLPSAPSLLVSLHCPRTRLPLDPVTLPRHPPVSNKCSCLRFSEQVRSDVTLKHSQRRPELSTPALERKRRPVWAEGALE